MAIVTDKPGLETEREKDCKWQKQEPTQPQRTILADAD